MINIENTTNDLSVAMRNEYLFHPISKEMSIMIQII